MGNRIHIMGITLGLLTFAAVSVSFGAGNRTEDPEEEMVIEGLGFDQTAKTPVVLLADKKIGAILPIWVGLCEARSIEIGLSGIVPPRPLTYDMIAAMVRTMKADVIKIVITDIRDRVYYSQVVMSVGGKISKIDARPSDALALATRMKSPIYVKKSVIEKAALIDSDVVRQEL
jgi:bifunctional DNase/RNase